MTSYLYSLSYLICNNRDRFLKELQEDTFALTGLGVVAIGHKQYSLGTAGDFTSTFSGDLDSALSATVAMVRIITKINFIFYKIWIQITFTKS